MSLTLSIEGREATVSFVRLDAAAERWTLCIPDEEHPGADKEIGGVWNPLNFPASDCDPAKFSIALFTHRDWPESQVLSLKEDSRSVGLIFSIQALTSGSTILSAKKMFNDYGFMALSKLCSGDTFCHVGARKVSLGETYEISDLYDDDSVVAIFQTPAYGSQTLPERDFKDYVINRLPSFVRSGLFLQLEEGAARVRQSGKFEKLPDGQSCIRLRAFSSELPESTRLFMIELLTRTDPYEEHPAFRFFLYYQVFESLIQEMYEEYYAKFSQLALDSKFRRASEMKDLVEWLHEKLNEKNRLSLLVGSNRRSGDEFDSLRDGCDEILRALGDAPSHPSVEVARGTANPATAQPSVPVAASAVEASETGPVAVGTQAAAAQGQAKPAEPAARIPSSSGSGPALLAGAIGVDLDGSTPDRAPLTPTPSSPAPPPESHAKLLYQARNLLFHSFSKVTGKGEELEELANSMARAIYDLATEYKKPPITPPAL